MKVTSSKENILKKVRQALSESVPLPFPKSEGNSSVYQPATDDLEVQFAQEFTRLLGKFAFCADEADLVFQLKTLIKQNQWASIFSEEQSINKLLPADWFNGLRVNDVEKCDASITSCECLIARTGSIVLSSGQSHGRTASVYAPIHICIAYANQLVYDIKDGLQRLKEKYGAQLPSSISFATGPSRTADIEKTLVVGVHGPKEVYLFLVDSPPST
jgi:L-lactate dehydrogenase complex protein LldG